MNVTETSVIGEPIGTLVTLLAAQIESADPHWIQRLDELDVIRFEWRAWSAVGAFLIRDSIDASGADAHLLVLRGMDRTEWTPRGFQAIKNREVWDPIAEPRGTKMLVELGIGDIRMTSTCWAYQYARVRIEARTSEIPAYDEYSPVELDRLQLRWDDRVLEVLECSVDVNAPGEA